PVRCAPHVLRRRALRLRLPRGCAALRARRRRPRARRRGARVTPRSALYRGELVHARHDRFARVFRYPVYMAALDPSELPDLDRRLRLFSLGRRNVFALDARDYTTPLARAPGASATRIVTNLRTLGYVFNPVSFFIHYDGAAPAALTAEVNNTYRGRHCYELDATHRL